MKIFEKKTVFVLIILLSGGWMIGLYSGTGTKKTFHSENELRIFRSHRSYSYATNTLFTSSGICLQCHGSDVDGITSVDASGTDINIMDDWAATMMANSARDPFWRAKVSHEILVNPTNQTDLENKCTSCHAPMGKFNALHNGQVNYGIADLVSDSVGLDGVSCGACHQIKDTLVGDIFSGNIIYDTNHVIYGPYTNVFNGPMLGNIGYDAVYSPHINDAGLCANCHTLITSTVDLAGNYTGTDFVEQATYHEWLNSDFNTETNVSGITCQGCHIPRTSDTIILSNGHEFLPGQTPFGKHHLVGGNSFMLKLMKNNISLLNLLATASQYDSVIARTDRLLRYETLDMTLTEASRTPDTVFYNLSLTNKAGHKFPSGYPSRRAYVEFVVMDDNGDTLFKTGMLDGNAELINQDAGYEPHYNMINSQLQVQIYEMVMGDVNSNVTTVLERAATPLKDNRITPKGFTTTHNAYDTCVIAGNALSDPDFNLNGVTEGTGADILHLHIPLAGYTGDLNVTARVYYQSSPRRWMQEMFAYNSAEIDLFENLFNAADHTPSLVAEILMGNMFNSINELYEPEWKIFPNPVREGKIFISGLKQEDIISVTVINTNGQTVINVPAQLFNGSLELPETSGTYFIRVSTTKGIVTKPVVKTK